MHNIMIVEDNPDHQFILSAHLKAGGYRTLIAESGLQGIKLLSTEKISLIVLDLWLPTLDGLSFLKNLRSYPEWSSIPVIVASGVDQFEASPTLSEFGVAKYFVKPYNPDELLKTISLLLQSEPNVPSR